MEIELNSPQGNAFYLLGMVKKLKRELQDDDIDDKAIVKDMMSGDYDHLCKVFHEHFGHVVTLTQDGFEIEP